MKTTTPILLVVAALLGLAVNLHSQGVAPKSPVDQLRDLKTKNDEIIEKQKADPAQAGRDGQAGGADCASCRSAVEL